MSPEEKLAQRILRKYSVQPPVNVTKILKNYAQIEYANIPIPDVDGVSLDIKVPGKTPKVIVNTSIPINRQKFTLAHELGHIIIPWHIGSIIEDRVFIDDVSYQDPYEYQEMEREANKFAAELLMPSELIKEKYSDSIKLSDFHSNITNHAEVSPVASAIRIVQLLEEQIAFGEVDGNDILRNFGKSSTANILQIEKGRKINKNTYKKYAQYSSWIAGSTRFHWWKFDSKLELYSDDSDDRSWREILDKMVVDLSIQNSKKYKASLNAVIANANSIFKRDYSTDSIEKLNSLCFQKLDRRDFSMILEHKDFETFLKKKIIELYNRKK